jgi:NlpC/P60 family putative phage cell wall peptidase
MGSALATADLVVAEARRWLKTPFLHQGRLRGVGVDCAGVVIGVAHDLGLSAFDVTGYARHPDGRSLEAMCDANMTRVAMDEVRAGDVLLMRFGREPQHLAIVTQASPMQILHAQGEIGACVEHSLDVRWRRRIVRAYRLPGVA